MAEKRPRTGKGNTQTDKRPAEAAKAAPTGIVAKGSFPIVALGASAGGLEAFEQFFRNLPHPTGAAFVVISHLAPTHESMMSELISRFTRLTVAEATDGVEVAPEHVYVIPPGRDLSIFNGRLQVSEPEISRGTRMPIDFFLRSLAEDRGERAVVVILSGTGSDGTLGLRAVQGSGGIVFVQEPADAKYDGMPQSAIRTGLADYVLPAREIPRQLLTFLERYGTRQEFLESKGLPEVMQKILRTIRSKTGHDFSQYKKNTMLRRIQRRMNVHGLDNPAAYLRYIQEHADEANQLFKELLINVTNFFREPEAFDLLKETVLPEILKDKPPDYTIRVWVAGCATGEEAYSIAMTIREYAEETRSDYRVQMFATDIDADSIGSARTGFFPPNIALDVTAARLARFFVKEETGYRVRKDIRETIVFAPQNVTKDPPFTRLDLVSCRNVLIYMDSELQSRLITLFHYSLNEGGVLFLGSSESIGPLTPLFSSIDRKWKFFRAKPAMTREAHLHAPEPPGWASAGMEERSSAVPAKRINLEETARRALLSMFAPPAVIVNEKGDILYIHGDTAKYLTPAPGRPSLNITDMTREGLQVQMRSALMAAARHRQDAVYRGIVVRTNGSTETVDLSIRPLPETEGEERLFMFMFQTSPERKTAEPKKSGTAAYGGRTAELEKELAYTKESLQAAIGELQATNEELRSGSEEMQSTNEELQSTNEELETSKEELQSVNEELTTVNSELQSKIEQLSRAESDMKNLLDSTDIATIFLDAHLRVKRFTASATRIVNLIPTDVGRPIDDVTVKVEISGIGEKARDVLDRLRPFETEVKARDDKWFLMRILPYRTLDNVIDGVVITFTDITEPKRGARERAEFAENIVQTVREPLLVLDDKLRVIMANRAFYRLFDAGREATEGRSLKDLGGHEWNIDALLALLSDVIKDGKVFDDFEVEANFPTIGARKIRLNARKLKAAGDGTRPLVLLAMEDAGGMGPKAGESGKKEDAGMKADRKKDSRNEPR